jgi:nucleoid DNA-binding protein
MDNRSFNTNLTQRLDTDAKTATGMADALTDLLRNHLAQLDTIAIPGFGTFIPAKTDEYIATDSVTGKRSLMPPAVSITFRAGSRLKKSTAPHKS